MRFAMRQCIAVQVAPISKLAHFEAGPFRGWLATHQIRSKERQRKARKGQLKQAGIWDESERFDSRLIHFNFFLPRRDVCFACHAFFVGRVLSG